MVVNKGFILEPKKERRTETPVYDSGVRKGIKLETIIMAGILAVMSFATFIVKDMHSDIKTIANIAVKNQTMINAHVQDQRAHVPIR